ncbi:MAG: 23S rRNA (pseudouridine(1915)-N(3))-methyltransferase RlmH [Bacteroidales bacterium]|nr:23S rRNA (pseudouridine(1915)-N(3))-methyltransferase RlmH [Bacteroidales bacterium]
MKLSLIQVGKTDEKYLAEGLSVFYSRIRKMIPLEVITIKALKESGSKPESVLKKEEANEIASRFRQGDFIILLDEKGDQMTSRDFASFLQKIMNSGPRRIVFVIGGAWGLSDLLENSAERMLSLSSMTFSHQLVRLLFAEQLYRALTILRGIPYHHD